MILHVLQMVLQVRTTAVFLGRQLYVRVRCGIDRPRQASRISQAAGSERADDRIYSLLSMQPAASSQQSAASSVQMARIHIKLLYSMQRAAINLIKLNLYDSQFEILKFRSAFTSDSSVIAPWGIRFECDSRLGGCQWDFVLKDTTVQIRDHKAANPSRILLVSRVVCTSSFRSEST